MVSNSSQQRSRSESAENNWHLRSFRTRITTKKNMMLGKLTNKPRFSQFKGQSHTCTHLEAISIGSTASRRICKQGRIGKVQSVFRRAFNILTPDNRLISVVQEDLGRGPINIVTKAPNSITMISIGIQTDNEVARVDDQLIVGNNILTVSTKNAKKWKPRNRFQDKLLTIEKIIDNLNVMKEIVS